VGGVLKNGEGGGGGGGGATAKQKSRGQLGFRIGGGKTMEIVQPQGGSPIEGNGVLGGPKENFPGGVDIAAERYALTASASTGCALPKNC